MNILVAGTAGFIGSYVAHKLLDDGHEVERLFKRHNIERVWHLAHQASVRHSLEKPLAYEATNMAGHLNILECRRNFEVDRLAYALSSSICGGNTTVPITVVDIEQAKAKLGYQPKTSLKDGLEKFVAWYKEWKS